jgi:hypothetical protein
MRALALIAVGLALLALGATAFAGKPDLGDVEPQPIAIEATPFVLDPAAPKRRRFGKLDWIGGVELRSSSPYFGGYSGLLVNADGSRLLAVSDAGLWLAAGIETRDGRIAGLDRPRTGSLRGKNNRPLSRKRHRDAESLAPTSPGALEKPVFVAFEQLHRVGRFPVRDGGLEGPTRYLSVPQRLRKADGNTGIEGLALLTGGPSKGALLALAEHLLDAKGDHSGWILGTKVPKALTLERLDGFDVTGAASLPGGDVLVLERRFSWFRGIAARIRGIAAADIKPGARLTGEILLDLGSGLNIDNMEGLAVHRSAGGRTVITLISDDNFNHGLQRTLLMQFALPEDGAR